jgi:hypothetical protein
MVAAANAQTRLCLFCGETLPHPARLMPRDALQSVDVALNSRRSPRSDRLRHRPLV